VVMSISDNDIASYYPNMIYTVKEKSFERIDDGMVDGELYVSVVTKTGSEVDYWLAQHGAIRTSAQFAFQSYFDMPEKLYMMLVLRWG